ncbi:unnamed protein product [Pedinophyceae sp. YPF-701]|nr:unnamed protein product [Pedinophyceae sp. YPF-701]
MDVSRLSVGPKCGAQLPRVTRSRATHTSASPQLCRIFPAAAKPPARRGGSAVVCSSQQKSPVSVAEAEANAKRWQESGGGQGSQDEWRWTLNWDEITDKITVGSCPRSPSDVQAIAEKSGCTAILGLQCDDCLSALEIDYKQLRARGTELGVQMVRVQIRDFDKNDQTFMLPEAVTVLASLIKLGHKVYVHCTAGINRATLTTVGFLTFVEGMELEQAVGLVRHKRPQAHPYIECWQAARRRILAHRREEVGMIAGELYAMRVQNNQELDDLADFYLAERMLVQRSFQRRVRTYLALWESQRELLTAQLEKQYESDKEAADKEAQRVASKLGGEVPALGELESLTGGLSGLQLTESLTEMDGSLSAIRGRLHEAQGKLAMATRELQEVRSREAQRRASGSELLSSTDDVLVDLSAIREEVAMLGGPRRAVGEEVDEEEEVRQLRRALRLMSETTKCLLDGGKEAECKLGGLSNLLMSTNDDEELNDVAAQVVEAFAAQRAQEWREKEQKKREAEANGNGA